MIWSILFSFNLWFHPHFVSVSHLNYKEESKTLEITHRIFTDDFERALSFRNGQKIDLLNDSLIERNIEVINQYLIQTSSIKVNGQIIIPNFVGFEEDEEAILIYREVNCEIPKEINIRLNFLTEIISTQNNIVHFKYDKQKKSTQLSKNKPEVEWVLN
ncbi:MAG: hypothetical protein IPO62_16740 [Saprospiraceae bacterium]|nr:hypothetical protein [Saprospiraceae bacterium]MBK9632675.1 hypothetical protein [Saprospiraceae bacterium]